MSLSGLVDYLSSSEESDEDCEVIAPKRSRLIEKNCQVSNKVIITSVENKLPLPPESFLSKFETKTYHADNPHAHDGRIRSFKHEVGNWATFVSVLYPYDLSIFLTQVMSRLSSIAKFHYIDDPHLSLSRTVPILYHWIDVLVDDIKTQIVKTDCKSCRLKLGEVKAYCNDEKTRTFLGLTVNHHMELHKYVNAVDKSFHQFHLPSFYKNPSFHISILWCLGDMTSHLSSSLLNELTNLLKEYFSKNIIRSHFEASELRIKTGNKIFRITLPVSSTST